MVMKSMETSVRPDVSVVLIGAKRQTITILDYDVPQQRLKAFPGDLILEDEVGRGIGHLFPVCGRPSRKAGERGMSAKSASQ